MTRPTSTTRYAADQSIITPLTGDHRTATGHQRVRLESRAPPFGRRRRHTLFEVMRRRSVDHLVPNEQRTLRAAWLLQQQGTQEVHGYLLARQLKNRSSSAPLMAYSTVYRCLDRLEERGLIESFEHDDRPSGGPPRRHFRVTARGGEVARALPDDGSGFDVDPTPGGPTTSNPTPNNEAPWPG